MEQSLWKDAARDMPVEWQEQLQALSDVSCGPCALLEIVKKEQANCQAKRWQCRKLNGQKVYIRDVLEKVASWLEKVKDIGDVIVQYDPAHASLPWAGTRFLLMAATSDVLKFGAMVESIEIVVGIVSRYTLIEQIYGRKLISEASQQLRKSIVKVYSAILVFLCKAKKYFAQNSAQRIALSIFQLEKDSDDLTHDVATKDAAMKEIRSIVDGEMANNTLHELHLLRSDAKIMKNILSDLENPVTKLNLQLDCIQDNLNKKERRKIMHWLSIEEYRAHHKSIARTRLPSSGLWLFQKSEYQSWRESSLCSLLWLHGHPGAGKSVLVSLVIDQISDELRSLANPPQLAYFYCTRESSEPKRAEPTEIMLSILRQLSCTNDDTPIIPPVAEKWRERQSQGSEHRLDLDECLDVIIEIMKERPAIIVIDALDECKIETRADLMNGLERITQEAKHLVKVFVSSRRDSDILNYFSETPTLEIATGDNSQDIENYISTELKEKILSRKLLNGKPSKELLRDVEAKLIEGAEGIFRWVSAFIQTLCHPSMQFEQDIRLALRQLPRGLKGVYVIIIEQIHTGSPMGMLLAKRALRWLLCAKQILNSKEFIKALSADLSISSTTITVDDLLNVCCNLVKYDIEQDVVRFMHLSVREYLESNEMEYEKSLSHSVVATACLQAYLYGPKPKRKAHFINGENKTFYDYAKIYWPTHCMESGDYRRQGELGKLFNDFIFDKKKFQDWLSSWEDSWQELYLYDVKDLYGRGDKTDSKLFKQLRDCKNRWCSPIFLSCAFGFMEVLQDNRSQEEKFLKRANTFGQQPFNVAVRHGQRQILEHLWTSPGQQSADEGALIAAISMSQIKLASILLEKNPQLSITEEMIKFAVRSANFETVEFLFTKISGVDITTELINGAASNESSGKQIIHFLLGLVYDVSIVEETIEIACSNSGHGLAILESLLSRSDDSTITEDAMECAASNNECGIALLRVLFHRASHLDATTAMIESACKNSTLEPLRFLLSRNKMIPISYCSLRIATVNREVGDQMLALLLERCNITLLDESLLILAMENRKFGIELTKLLLAKAGGTTLNVTTDILETAAGNKYLGEALIKELLINSKERNIHPDIATAAAKNLYSPIEVLNLLLEADEKLEITTDTIIAAAENPQYALELLQYIISRDPNIKITSDVIEAAAANEQNGFDVIQFLSRLGPVTVTTAAFEAAAGNRTCGDKILDIWLRNKLPNISSVAVETAMKNSSLGPEILMLLFRKNKVELSPKAIEYAAMNPFYGPKLINTIMMHRGSIVVTEELLEAALNNQVTGSEVLEVLLTHMGSARVSPAVVESALGSLSNADAIETLLNAATPAFITPQAVQYAFCDAVQGLKVLGYFKRKNPDVFLVPGALEAIIKGIGKTDDLIEIFKLLETCGKDVSVSQIMVKRAVTRSRISVLLALANYCDKRREAMPITQEVVEAALRQERDEAPTILEYLLKRLQSQGQTIKVDEHMVLAAVGTSWAENALKMLSEFTSGAMATSRRVIDRAAVNPQLSNFTIEKLLGIDPRQLKELQNGESLIIDAIKNSRSEKGLKKWLLALNKPVQVTENVMKAAAAYSSSMNTILDILQIQDQQHLIPSLVSPEVVQAAEWTALSSLREKMRDHGQTIPLTPEYLAKIVSDGPNGMRLVLRILRERGQECRFSDLVTDEVVVAVLKSRFAVELLKFLMKTLGDKQLRGMLSESHLMIAAGAMRDDYIDFLYPLVSSVHPKRYYKDISALNHTVWKVRPVALRKLLERKVFPNVKLCSTHPIGFADVPPLGSAACFGDLVIVRLMLKYPEVDPNLTERDGRTPLSIAASRGHTLIVKALLNRGVDRFIKDKDEKTAQDRAVENGNYMIAEMIRDFEIVVQPEGVIKEDESLKTEMEKSPLRKSRTL